MLTAAEQAIIRKAAQRLASAAKHTERLRRDKAIPLHHFSPREVKAREALADLLKEVG